MQTETIRQYLTAIGESLAEHVAAWAVDEFDDGTPVLALSIPSPLVEGTEMGCTVSLEVFNDTLFLFDLEYTVLMNVPGELFAPLNKVIAALNNAAVIGSFALADDTAEVIYRDGVLIDGSLDSRAAAVNVVRTLAAMENAAINGGREILRLINGEIAADELIAEFNDLGGDEE